MQDGTPVKGFTPTDVEAVIQEATKRLIDDAHPEKIILFGSYARGDFDKNSDLDFLVILRAVEGRFDEMVRLREVFRGIPMPIDVMVYSVDDVQQRKNLRSTVLYHALAEGRVLHDAA